MARWLAGLILALGLAGTVGQADSTHYGAPASVRILVPVGATLTVDGVRTHQMTAVRHFVSPTLPHGKRFVYTFQANYTWFGEPVARKQEVEVWANAVISVDMEKSVPVAPPPPPLPMPVEDQWTKPATPTTPPKVETPSPKFPGIEAPKIDPLKVEPPKPATPKPDLPKTEIPKVDPPKPAPKAEPPKPAAPKAEPPKVDIPKVDPPRTAAPAKQEEKIKPEIEVPFVPTPKSVVETMLKLAEVKPSDVVFDLGCGDGRIPITAVKQFQARKGIGIDFNPVRIQDCLANSQKETPAIANKLEFRTGDVLKLTEKDFADVDVVTLYLLPEVNLKLRSVLQKGLKPGSRVVSHDFDMGEEWMPDETRMVLDEDSIEHIVYLWKIKKP